MNDIKMIILHLLDTHGKHNLLTQLPKADVIVHCVDLSDNGRENEVL